MMQVAYYYRTTHRDHGYGKYVEPGKAVLDKKYDETEKKERVFWDEASGADGNRKEFRRLLGEIEAGHIHVVVTKDAAMIARDWKQFMEFMGACKEHGVEVLCFHEREDAAKMFERIQKFISEYFEGGMDE